MTLCTIFHLFTCKNYDSTFYRDSSCKIWFRLTKLLNNLLRIAAFTSQKLYPFILLTATRMEWQSPLKVGHKTFFRMLFVSWWFFVSLFRFLCFLLFCTANLILFLCSRESLLLPGNCLRLILDFKCSLPLLAKFMSSSTFNGCKD